MPLLYKPDLTQAKENKMSDSIFLAQADSTLHRQFVLTLWAVRLDAYKKSKQSIANKYHL